HVKAIDTYWICTAEHGLNASTFTARIVASTGADCGAALSSAVGALTGPLHGGAPAYVKPMLEEVAEVGDPARWVREALASGKRIMGFGHRIYRAEDPRSRLLKGTAKELGAPNVEVAEQLEAAARSSDFRERAAAYRAVGQFRFRQKLELLRRGLDDESPACRGSALVSLELLSREHPGVVNAVRPLLHELAARDPNQA